MTDLSTPATSPPGRARAARRRHRQLSCANWLIEAPSG